MKVLVVEDSYTQARVHEVTLVRHGFKVLWAPTLSEAVQVLDADYDIDAILLDLNLPDSEGIETFYTIAQVINEMPVVVVTSHDDQEAALEALQGGAQDYVIKGQTTEDGVVRSLRMAIERSRVEKELRVSEKRTRLIVENCTDAFIACNSAGVIKGWNRQAEAMFGWRREEVVGKTLAETIIPRRLLAVHQKDLERLARGDREQVLRRRGELQLLHRDGREISVEIGLFPVILGNGQDELCAFVHDITYRKQIEARIRHLNEELEQRVQERTAELARSNAELQQFAKVASHDLQEPLRAVEGYSRLLAKRYKGRLDKDADEFIDFILDGVDRMLNLIQSLLQHASIGTTDVKSVQLVDCKQVIADAMANLRLTIEESHAKVEVVGDLPSSMVANRTEMLQLFQNLINNAIKYRDKNRAPEIRIHCEENVHEWVFSVQDNGIGIDPRYTEKIFDMFARLHGKTEYQGTGIGLAICKKIVETHGGRIWVQSEPGHGSIFLFTLLRFRSADEGKE